MKEGYERACCIQGYHELAAFLAKATFSAELLAGAWIAWLGRNVHSDPLGSGRLPFGLKQLRIDIANED